MGEADFVEVFLIMTPCLLIIGGFAAASVIIAIAVGDPELFRRLLKRSPLVIIPVAVIIAFAYHANPSLFVIKPCHEAEKAALNLIVPGAYAAPTDSCGCGER